MVCPKELLYREEGEMPSLIKVPAMAGLKWTKKYISGDLNREAKKAMATLILWA
jgi:hypothetical protein